MSLPSSFIPDTENNPGLPSSFIPNGKVTNPAGGQEQKQSSQPNEGNFLTNLLPSLGKNLGNIGSAAVNTFNPDMQQNTVANLARIPIGVGEEIGKKLFNNPDFQSQSTQEVENLGNFYKNRYGSPQNIVNSINQDPVGVAMDASSLLDGGASLAGETGTLGKILSTASDVTNPVAMAGKGVTGVGKLASAPFKGSFNPDIANLAQEMGVNLPASAMTNNKVVQIGEALASKGLFGQKIINKIQMAKDQLNTLAQQTTDSVNTAPDFLTAGEAAQNGFTKTKQAFQQKMNDLYGQIVPQIKDQPADAATTVQVLKNIMDNAKNNLGNNPATAYYQGLQARIAPIQELTTKGMVSPDQQLTAAELRATMQDVGNKLKNPNDPIASADQGAMKQLYGALSQDLDNTISRYDPAVGQQLKDTNAQYAQGKQLFNSQIGKYIQDKDPEQIVNQLFKPNSVTNIQRVKQMVGEDGFGQLQHAFLAKLMKNSLDSKGVLDSGKLATNLGKYDEPTLNAMFSPDQLQQLESAKNQLGKVDTLKGALAKGTKVSDGSQTAYIANLAAQPALMAASPLLWLKQLGLQYAYAKPFTTDAGINFLTKGGKNVAAPVGNGIQNNAQLLNLLRMAHQK